MPALLLIGEYLLRFDQRGRMLLPSEVRRRINPDVDGQAFYVLMGRNDKVWMYPDLYYERLTLESLPPVSTDASSGFAELVFALAWRVEPEQYGRILLPEKLIQRAGLKREATLIGVRDHLEIWNTPEWEEYRDQLMTRFTDFEK